ncbi:MULTISPECIES: TetR/AcrR family transcriptional regulator [unclassified Sphingomonas]|jgi:AcrR family transcriptional regulator|uniref:TetR/AcrR family transcriptional regulator n=1 Tax=unclassified Sphingomonas TaxID=196159 RepID=UPI0022B3C332|nr:TetR/AcrR family transcriptional regulator [Sphingomonas sp. NIBR02145]WHU01050.1 TetR/AcrR family transcriptional regulator [Sphingomonas sp. NIBR02145]
MTKIVEKAPGKREARKEERREAILAIAKRVFLDQGYSGASMSAISAELGGSKGTLWSYFPSKEELFAAVLDDATKDYRAQLADVLKPGEDVSAAVRQFCKGFIAKVSSPDGLRLHRLIASEVARFPEIGDIFYRRAPLPTQQMLAAFFERVMDAGQLRREDPLFAARVLASLCLGVQQRMIWGQELSAAERDREAGQVADIFLRAFAPE